MEEPGNTALSSLYKLLRNRLMNAYVCVGVGGCYTPTPLAGSVTIYAKTTVLCSPDSSLVIQDYILSLARRTYSICGSESGRNRNFRAGQIQNRRMFQNLDMKKTARFSQFSAEKQFKSSSMTYLQFLLNLFKNPLFFTSRTLFFHSLFCLLSQV